MTNNKYRNDVNLAELKLGDYLALERSDGHILADQNSAQITSQINNEIMKFKNAKLKQNCTRQEKHRSSAAK